MNQPQQPMNLITLQIIWGAMLVSQLVYCVVLQMKIDSSEGGALNNPMVLQMLGGMALVMLAGSVFLPRLLLKQLNSQKKLLTEQERIQGYATPFIIRIAMLESVALFGFGAGFLTGEMANFYPFVAVSVAGLLLSFPTLPKIQAAFKSHN